MDAYGKIFKKFNTHDYQLRPYNPDKEKYFKLIEKARNDGFKQVIINSELMIELLYRVLEKEDGLLFGISMSDTTDSDVKENIEHLIRKLRSNKLLFVKLKEELEWAVDSESIDISYIDVYVNHNRYHIYSNAIVVGTDILKFFDDFLEPILGRYFNA